MKSNKILNSVAALILVAASPAMWAGSALPPNTPPESFIADIFDANASGTKYSGKLTIAYEVGDLPEGASCDFSFYRNMYVVLVLQQGNQSRPFTSQYSDHASGGFCGLDGGNGAQQRVITDLIANKVKPEFCPTCNKFSVKSITNFQYIQPGSARLASPHVGGLSADITIALD